MSDTKLVYTTKPNPEVIKLIGKIKYDEVLRIGKKSLCNLYGFEISDEIFINYYISDIKLTEEEFIKNDLLSLIGGLSFKYQEVYGTEWTGYMWTDEEFKIGGHDLHRELTNHIGKYCFMKIHLNKSGYREDVINKIIDQ